MHAVLRADPILMCAGIIADGRLLDLLRRVYCFGTSLMKLDLRQQKQRHTEALDAITQCAQACCPHAACHDDGLAICSALSFGFLAACDAETCGFQVPGIGI